MLIHNQIPVFRNPICHATNHPCVHRNLWQNKSEVQQEQNWSPSLLLLYTCYYMHLHEELLLLFKVVTKLLFQAYNSTSPMK